MQMILQALPSLVPLLPFAVGCGVHRCNAATAGRWAIGSAAGSMGLAAAGVAAFATLGTPVSSGFQVPLQLDILSSVMVLLVSYLGWVVMRFSRNYLAGDPGQSRFFSWMCLTLGCVLTLVLSNHLLVLFAAWVATSLSLHRLLLHYPDRPGAVFAARKKFVISRMGDLLLLAALILTFRKFGTWEMSSIFRSVAEGQTAGLTPICLLLAGCAALKSAQFPFHGWLPDTMETPTPVSAFMHAGIINAGGFLIVRMSPLFAHAPSALALLAGLGTLTAAFGAVVMLAQPSVKRSLAYSTIAQMGFMFLQCGLGAFGLAVLHIVAHSLYKAHAFLSAGSTIGAVPRAAIRLRLPALGAGLLAGALIVAAGVTTLHIAMPTLPHVATVFTVVLALALAYGIARAMSAGGGTRMIALASAAAAAIAAATFALHAVAGLLFKSFPQVPVPHLPALLALVVFSTLFIFQAFLWRAGHHPLGRSLYVHALNGFYIGTWGNRLLGRLWPSHPTATTTPATLPSISAQPSHDLHS